MASLIVHHQSGKAAAAFDLPLQLILFHRSQSVALQQQSRTPIRRRAFLYLEDLAACKRNLASGRT
jgi:hypothetical protein